MHLGVDVGGTFTDVVAWDGSEISIAKVPTTPGSGEGVVAGASRVAGGGSFELAHGTTAATNALLERRGGRTALVTDNGFEDLIEIGRQDRPSLYDGRRTRPEPLVPRTLRFGVFEDPVAARDLIGRLRSEEVDAVAVCFLRSALEPTRERALAQTFREALPNVRIVASSEVVTEPREYERFSTAVLDAYLAAPTENYLRDLGRRLADAGARTIEMMTSAGGLQSLDRSVEHPASIVLSGPAGGVVAAGALTPDHRLVVSFDMGGTSTDVCRIEAGRPVVGYERYVGGVPSVLPTVAVHTVGAGGGSVAWVDAGGALRVGPESAGAVPGPAAYGRGGRRPTVTDANVVLGRLPATQPLASGLELAVEAARQAVGTLPLPGSVETIAEGIVEVVESEMERALRAVSVEDGVDPREAVLVGFGGAGGLHAAALARRLGMDSVMIPSHGGVLSALGLLLAPRRVDVGVPLTGSLEPTVERCRAQATAALPGAVLRELVGVRYRGQSYELMVPAAAGDVVAEFHRMHRERNGFARPDAPVELVSVRVEATAPPVVDPSSLPAHRPVGPAHIGTTGVVHAGSRVEADVVRRQGLRPGHEIVGPAIIVDEVATTWVAPGELITTRDDGALIIRW